MTYCLVIKVHDGPVALSDTMITAGREHLTAAKVIIPQ